MLKWQKIHRLIGSTDPAWIADNLFLHSLVFLKVLPSATRDLLDLGAGAGFPGVPLKIVVPGFRLTMVESRERRASFLAAVVRELGLADTQVINARAEDLTDQPDFRFDAVVMRRAGSPGDLFPTALDLLRPGGVVVASGPPRPTPLEYGEWVEVPGPGGLVRRFAVCRKDV